jgi:hypothetical protein
MALTPRGSKKKGDNYERELAKFFNDCLFGGRDVVFRAPLSGGGRQFAGGGGSADLSGAPAVWVEAKRTETFSPYRALEQAEKGIKGKAAADLPVVVSRRSRMPTGSSLVVMRLDDWMRLYHAYLTQFGYKPDEIQACSPTPATDPYDDATNATMTAPPKAESKSAPDGSALVAGH